MTTRRSISSMGSLGDFPLLQGQGCAIFRNNRDSRPSPKDNLTSLNNCQCKKNQELAWGTFSSALCSVEKTNLFKHGREAKTMGPTAVLPLPLFILYISAQGIQPIVPSWLLLKIRSKISGSLFYSKWTNSVRTKTSEYLVCRCTVIKCNYTAASARLPPPPISTGKKKQHFFPRCLWHTSGQMEGCWPHSRRGHSDLTSATYSAWPTQVTGQICHGCLHC